MTKRDCAKLESCKKCQAKYYCVSYQMRIKR